MKITVQALNLMLLKAENQDQKCIIQVTKTTFLLVIGHGRNGVTPNKLYVP